MKTYFDDFAPFFPKLSLIIRSFPFSTLLRGAFEEDWREQHEYAHEVLAELLESGRIMNYAKDPKFQEMCKTLVKTWNHLKKTNPELNEIMDDM